MSAADILAGLAPMFVKARAEGLWFWCNYQNLWFSPDELEAWHRAGKFVWSAENWRLRNPAERVTQLAGDVEKAMDALQAFIKRLGK